MTLPETVVHSNGSKWSGRWPAPVDVLLDRLAKYQLDRERFPRPYHPCEGRPGFTTFFGNFRRYSHVFRIDSNDPDVVARLTRAIDANASLPHDCIEPFWSVEVVSGPYRGVYDQRRDGLRHEWVLRGRPNSMPIPMATMQRWADGGKIRVL
jgi:hypothetical protein